MIDRLEEEHHVIAAVLDEVDRALVAVVSEAGRRWSRCVRPSTCSPTRWPSHLSYEERMLVEPLARYGFY